ncbi:uncharacterized protein FIBRA_01287 [Fibroporia radiculosa]|uniref:Zn(2)-C6 fungal-type domain-containing protein n=1 Tax=Fibroporia radiculosa TaxID=599839 RepID=J4HT27_9APHY|nr:uncharacterized protein FIBRA_01287 [Fibroporia radiculosa]CCL99272.1 predicted protein [Fibroporia radiculosa]
MSDFHIITPSERESSRKNQMLHAFQRFLAKSSGGSSFRSTQRNRNSNAVLSSPIPATTPSSTVVQQQQNATEALSLGLPKPSLPRIGVVNISDISRIRTPQACERCRERKTKCSGTRPTCKRCFHSGAQCVYVLDHKANRAQLRKLREAAGFFPKGLRPARKEGRTQRKPSPSKLDNLLRMWRSDALSSSESPKTAVPALSHNAPQPTEMIAQQVTPDPLASMYYPVSEESPFSQVPSPSAPSVLDSSYSFMEMDSKIDAAVTMMMANENIVLPQDMTKDWDSLMLAPPAMPSLSNSSEASSSSGCSPLPTPVDLDIVMADMFGPDAVAAPALPVRAGPFAPELPSSDSELERELEREMAEIFGSTNDDGTVKFGLARPIEPMPVRPEHFGLPLDVPVPILPFPGRSFPPVNTTGAYFDENMFEAFRPRAPASMARVPEIKVDMDNVPASMNVVPGMNNADNDESQSTFDEIFNLAGGQPEVPPFSSGKLSTIVEDSSEACTDGGPSTNSELDALWTDLFGVSDGANGDQ